MRAGNSRKGIDAPPEPSPPLAVKGAPQSATGETMRDIRDDLLDRASRLETRISTENAEFERAIHAAQDQARQQSRAFAGSASPGA